MSIESKIETLTTARNSIRNKMVAAGQATKTDKLSTLAENLNCGVDTSDATATADDIFSPKTAYVNGSKLTGTRSLASSGEISQIVYNIFPNYEIKSFAEATDKQITRMLNAVRNGDITINDLGWKVGDERKVHLSAMPATGVGESHVEQDATLVILHGSNFFDLSDGSKNLFVIGLKNFLANGTTREGGYINSTGTNVGGWASSERRPWCDNVFMEALPEEVQKWFRKFKYKASDGNKQTTVTEMENYFTFPSRAEAFGGSNTSYTPDAEGTAQFDYYKTTANRIKYPGDSGQGSAAYWWLRSPLVGNTTDFCLVSGNGTLANAGATTSRGLAPFGCV